MKFWQKIYLFSILAFVLIFHIFSIMVIERNHMKMLEQEINSALSQYISIHSSVNAILPILRIYDSVDYEKTVLTNIANEFVEKNSEQRTYLQILNDSNQAIFSNTDFKMPFERKELDKLGTDEIRYILRDIDERTILFATNITYINHKSYVFTYMKDLTPVYQERVDQYSFFVKVDVAACILYMLIMYVVSKGLTKPIDRLNRTARVIAQGDFSERVQITTKDEIGVLAKNFNEMASVVEDKINDLELHNQQKQRFINNFTHELKTPLTSIIGFANFLRTTKYKEDIFLDALDVIYSEGKRLESFSLKLMDLVFLEEHHFQMEEHDLKATIAEMEPVLKMKAREKQISIVIDCEEGSLLMDKDVMKSLIFNLVDNALKASAKQQSITLRTYWSDNHYILEIIDQGIGIAKEHQDKIFEPFFMTDIARTRSNNGAGLGLSICHSIADIHKASIKVISEVNQGTTIQVIFNGTGQKTGVQQ
ncbi:HAMP domain-containing sensor histidine kinase [Brevibacillus halotolerans]|uniref:sensor histidine kinase n=1 Tax=Brevibacillus TaxID=55080 RepID=UPI00215C319B|nr:MULTISPECIES: HAMP domain-containing sensor histidine kinase [Brevibacillus]MCR8964955.1 HAMP domain-containing histidine kinase [Brevibacillus laterosporus]MCZ0837110.1 HAMP domain-containing sensor histidine kinase [Brevibacillus halotolerans]